jgi:MPBQ/MSBQ methyltransferase
VTAGAVERHYARDGLAEAIRDALRRRGKDPDHPSLADLAPLDEFHTRGRAATLELAEKVGLAKDSLVLDIGSGLGGPARLLAATYGCRVIGIDLTEAYCRTAATLTQWVGLADRVSFRHGNALDLSFADYQFDVVWTQHAAMNIADKATLYAEAHRVLKPGGKLALYDVLQGDGGALRFPVPWAGEPAVSHLVAPDALRQLLTGAGFDIASWRDTTDVARAWFAETARRIREKGAPPLGLNLLFGPEFAAMADNLRHNLEEGRAVLIEAVCRRG